MKEMKIKNGLLAIQFTYDPEMVAWVRTLAGRRWDPTVKTWTATLTKGNVESCERAGCVAGPDVVAWKANGGKAAVPAVKVQGLRKTLRPFQETGVGFIEQHHGRALLADEMGLGKTIQALAWLQHKGAASLPAVVVCPASAKLVWERECRTSTTGITCVVISGQMDVPHAGVYIINYDILARYETVLVERGVKTLIVDEAHSVKNRTAKRSKAVANLAKRTPHFIAMTGTPVVNRPGELYHTLSLLDPKEWGSWWNYAMRYCDAKNNGWGWDFSGASHTKELHERLVGSCMIRRTKAEVLPELPAKVRSVIPLECDLEDYAKAEANLIQWLRDNDPDKLDTAGRNEGLAKVEILKQRAVAAKWDAAVQWIDEWLETDGKLVLFCTHTEVVDCLMDRYNGKAVRVDGRDSQAARIAAVDAFQTNDHCRLFVGNLKAAGTALTLTAASNVAFMEMGWAPGDHDQAEDRVHRIGQTADSVGAHYLVASGTIEENICQLLDSKRKVVAAVTDGQKMTDSSEQLLTALLKEVRRAQAQ